MSVIPKAHVKRENTVLNSFVFCASSICSKFLMKKWKYDAFFKIVEPEHFAHIIFNELRQLIPIQDYNLGNISYVATKEIEITNINKADVIRNISRDSWSGFFVKPQIFSDEKEFRMIWVPDANTHIPKYVDLKIPNLRLCCRF